jgi:hypothetical protein
MCYYNNGSKPMVVSFQRVFNDGTKEENNNDVDLARSG